MRPLTRAIAICAGLVALSGVASAQRPSREPVVTAGLRPTSGSDYKATDIKRLSEAQRLREIADQIIKEIVGRPVLNHAGLRAALGSEYLVDFFDCKGAPSCVGRVLARLRERATLAVYGDYSVRRKNYLVRMRLLDLGTSKLLAEVEFSMRAGDIEDQDRWKRELTVLLAAVEVAEGQPADRSGDGERPADGEPADGEPADREPADGEPADREPPDGEASGSSTTTSADELTDADFGVVTTTAPAPVDAPRRDLPWIDLSTLLAMSSRYFDFENLEDQEVLRPDGFNRDWTVKVAGALEVYPLAFRKRGGHVERLGLMAQYGRTDVSAGGRETELYADVRYRIPVGSTATGPTFTLSAGFVRHDFVILEQAVDFPSVSYRGGTFGVDVRVPILTPRVALTAGARYMVLAAAGEIFADANYGDAERVGGLLAGGAIEVRPLDFVFLRLGASYTRFSVEFEGNGDESTDGSVGSRDRYLAAMFATGFTL